jgi:outer membrane receptor protein involved in Fe transport
MWGGHLALARELGANTRGYLRLARGFKAGGFNPSLAALQGVAQLGPQFVPYDEETLLNLELGIKGLWRDGWLEGDLALFRMRREDAQLSQSSQQVEFDPNSFVFVTYNGDADVQGLEASGRWRISPLWQLHGMLGLLDSDIHDTPATREVSPDAVHRELAHAPRYTANFGASFTGAGGWFGRVDVNAMDRFYYDISHNQRSTARTLVNLRLGYRWGDWEASAWVRNLTDETYYTRGFFFGNEPPGFEPTLYTRFGDPRQLGLTLEYRRADG